MRSVISKMLLSLCLAINISLAQDHAPTHVEILFIKSYRLGQLNVRSGETWYGLFRTSEGFRLRPTVLRVQNQDDHDSPDYPVRVTVVDSEETAFLVKGIPNLFPRIIPTVFWGDFFLPPSANSVLQLADSLKYSFHAKGEYRQTQGGQGLFNYKLDFYQIGKQYQVQTLAEFSQVDLDNPPSILWAGDLDNDGKLDFLLELGNHYAGSNKVLYLSSLAKGNNLVERVAELHTNAQ